MKYQKINPDSNVSDAAAGILPDELILFTKRTIPFSKNSMYTFCNRGCRIIFKSNRIHTMKARFRKKVKAGNPYAEMRNWALSIAIDELGLRGEDENKIVGMVMDWAVTKGMMTLMCFETGDASIYLSTGGGYIGGGQYEHIYNAAKSTVAMAQQYIAKAGRVTSYPLADEGCVRFYLLTSGGVFMHQVAMTDMEQHTTEWVPLFNEANDVISGYRIMHE